MKEITVIDNQDIKVTKTVIGGVTISQNVTPKVAIQDRTPAFDKKYAKWLY